MSEGPGGGAARTVGGDGGDGRSEQPVGWMWWSLATLLGAAAVRAITLTLSGGRGGSKICAMRLSLVRRAAYGEAGLVFISGCHASAAAR